jgi:hypothetical protein
MDIPHRCKSRGVKYSCPVNNNKLAKRHYIRLMGSDTGLALLGATFVIDFKKHTNRNLFYD